MERIAVLGLGAMGRRMAANLLTAGYEVVVYNRTPERAAALVEQGASQAQTPREAVETATLVISMLRDDDASRAVWMDEADGALLSLSDGALAITSSTLTPDWTTTLARAVEERGASFLDAPVAGTRPQAEAGQLAYLVGGAAEDVERAQPVFSVLGGVVHHVGPTGHGMRMKLAVNALFGIQVAAVAEVMGALVASGVDEARAVEVLGQTPVVSPAAKVMMSLMHRRAYAPMFPIELVEKDFGYVEAWAASAGATVPTAAAVREVYARAITEGHGDDNITGIAQLFLGAPASS